MLPEADAVKSTDSGQGTWTAGVLDLDGLWIRLQTRPIDLYQFEKVINMLHAHLHLQCVIVSVAPHRQATHLNFRNRKHFYQAS